jgi:hypothetical protein
MTLLDRVLVVVERSGVTTLAELAAAVGVEAAALAPMVDLLDRRGLVDRPSAMAPPACPGACGPRCGPGACPFVVGAPLPLSPPPRGA